MELANISISNDAMLTKKTDMFLKLLALKNDDAVIKHRILAHVSQPLRYVLFRNSSLYFFVGDTLSDIEQTNDDCKNTHYLRFDGEKLSVIDPEYYLGEARTKQAVQQESAEIGFAFSNNNNNNNNNNGNNNG